MSHESLSGRGPKLASRLSRQFFDMSRLSDNILTCDFRDRNWHVQTLANETPQFQTFATTMTRRNFHGQNGGAEKYCDLYLVFLTLDFCEQVLPFPDFRDRKTQRDFRDQGGEGSTSVSQETARPILVISRLSQSK